MKRLLTFALVAALHGVAAPSAAAQQEPEQQGFEIHLFPPELVMQNQQRIGLRENQRNEITAVIREFQGGVLDLQWEMQGETQRLGELLSASPVGEAAVLEQLDRVLAVEMQVKKAHITMLVRVKNALTQEQQRQLHAIRGSGE